MNNDVLIIGNGFDLYHKLPTRYTDFLVVVENWAEFWTLYRNNIKIEETENEVERETFSVSLGENGRLTQRALQDFANHAANLNSRNLEELNDIILKNVWIKYFVESGYSSDSWIDFEAEIEKVLITIEDFFTKDIFSCEGKMLLQPLPSNKAQIIKFMITNVQSFSLNVRIVSKRDIENLVYGNSKTELLNVLKNELDGLIKAFRIYMTEFVCNIKPMVRCPQIEQLLDVNLLSFNYTYTYKSKEMTEEWLDFIISCRSGQEHDYDIVIGAMADDQIYNFISDYIDGVITREQFWVLAKFKYPTHQIVFCTEAALKCLKYRDCEVL